MSWVSAARLRWTALGDGKDQSPSPQPNINLRRPVGGWSLENIPVELVQEVAKHLPPVEVAILALTSKAMLFRLGPRVLKIENVHTRHDLLEAFSERGMYLPEVLCQSCQIFHSPLPVDDGGDTHIRKCEPRNNPWGHGESPYLPAHISFNAVAGVMGCHEHNMSTAFPLETLSSSNEVDKDNFKIHTYNDLRIVDGHLILKTEKLLLPLGNATNKLEAVSQMSKFLRENIWSMDRCCRHTSWSLKYPALLDPKPSQNDKELDDLWTHSQLTPIVHACRYCFTDFSLGMTELPNGQGRACTLTSWKDLGSGKPSKGAEWVSHLYPDIGLATRRFDLRRTVEDEADINRLSPSAYRKFESIDESFGTTYQYRPTIDQERLIRLTGVMHIGSGYENRILGVDRQAPETAPSRQQKDTNHTKFRLSLDAGTPLYQRLFDVTKLLFMAVALVIPGKSFAGLVGARFGVSVGSN